MDTFLLPYDGNPSPTPEPDDDPGYDSEGKWISRVPDSYRKLDYYLGAPIFKPVGVTWSDLSELELMRHIDDMLYFHDL